MKVIFSITIDDSEVSFFENETTQNAILRIRARDDKQGTQEDFYMSRRQLQALKKAFKAIEAVKL